MASRRVIRGLTAALTLALPAGFIGIAPASAYSSPQEVPNPFQDYSAQDYADAIWNLETATYVRTHDRQSQGDCDVITYEVSHPLGQEPARTYVHIADPDDWWCSGAEADELREEFDAEDEADENFYHGRPYENVTQRVPYYGTWADVNGNGFDSRTEIHARDLGNSSFTVSGTYYDHYSGQTVNIGETETHGEHMIPVGHTWPEMQHRSRDARVAYYNDHMNLTTTIGSINREKGGHTPSEWMPSNEDAWCGYAMTWTHIANKHEVSLFRSDINHLRDVLWDCLDEEVGDGADPLPDERSPDLDWQSLPPSSEAEEAEETEEIAVEPGGGPREHYSSRDYADAVWNLENHVRIRSVDRESHDDCDVQTYTATHPRSGDELTYARVISPENTYCEGEEGDELRDELDEEAEDSDSFFHTEPLAGQRQEYFGKLTDSDGDGPNIKQQILARDFGDVEWNRSETVVRSGSFHDPYSGQPHDYSMWTTIVDHVMPVQHAWVEMQGRDEAERRDFYTDPMNLLAVSIEMAGEKRAEAPRDWMPPHEGFHCRYAMAWTHAAVKYEISLYVSDIRELRQTLYTCLAEETSAEASDGGDSDEASLDGPRREELEWASHPPY